MLIFNIMIVTALLILLYRRYIPVCGVQCMNVPATLNDDVIIIDVRDYNQSYKDSNHKSIHIPIAYLKRYVKEIPNTKLHVIAADPLEKNMSIRFLRKQGYQIIGYTLMNCDCKKINLIPGL
ncbi:hypothetical protein [Neobacillus sp. D3-1R]|uniref:hypothetical protein n=1 Tax=Neobacillus sp. D3-1R TaxID=3445778 RepID=UPI003FA0B1F7